MFNSTDQHVCFYTVFTIITLRYNCRLGIVMLSVFILLFGNVLAILNLLYFHMKLKIVLLRSVEGCAEFVDCP